MVDLFFRIGGPPGPEYTKRFTDVRTLLPMGDGVMWEIKRVEQDRAFLTDEDLTEEEREKFARVACSDPYFVLSVFRTWDGVGYRFAVEENRMPELIEYLADVEKYMLDYRVEI